MRLGPAAAGRRTTEGAPIPGRLLAATVLGAVKLALVRVGAARAVAVVVARPGAARAAAGLTDPATGRVDVAGGRLPARLLARVSGRFAVVPAGPDTFRAGAAVLAGAFNVEGMPLPDTLRLAGG